MDNLLIEVRYVEDDTRQSPGRLQGVLLTYGEQSRDRPELFRAGALAWDDGGIAINEQHNTLAAQHCHPNHPVPGRKRTVKY